MNFEPVPSSYYRRAASVSHEATASFLWVVYRWMAGGLALTGLTAWLVAHTPAVRELVLGNRWVFFGLLASELMVVMALSALVTRLSAWAAAGMFLGYSILNGLTLAGLFLVYTQASLAQTFFVSSASFAALSAYGATTKRDLSPVAQFMFVGLIGLVLASLVNMFFNNPAVYWVSTYAGVMVFAGLTAYDNQNLKHMYTTMGAMPNLAIHGALRLYLDFINMFLLMLRILGDRR